MKPDRKRRLVRAVEKYIVNPPVRAAFRLGVPVPMLAVLETSGRRTGKLRRTPVVDGQVDDTFWIVAEHGRKAGYVQNLVANPRVRVKKGRRWMEGTARVLEDDPFARAKWLAGELGRSQKVEALVTRLLAVEPVTVRVDLIRNEAAKRPGNGRASS